jgi:hypothetical protein
MLVEFSLNFNHVSKVLGGPHDNELHLPAQLLPLLIGAFGFLRTCYLLFEHFRSPAEFEPSLAALSPVQEARTLHMRDLPLAFSPAMARHSTTTSHDPDEMDELERRRGFGVRYIVAWLPWLSLLKHFQDETESNGRDGERVREKRLSDDERSATSPANFEKIDFAQPPRRGQQAVYLQDLPRPIGGGVAVHHGETI